MWQRFLHGRKNDRMFEMDRTCDSSAVPREITSLASISHCGQRHAVLYGIPRALDFPNSSSFQMHVFIEGSNCPAPNLEKIVLFISPPYSIFLSDLGTFREMIKCAEINDSQLR